MNEWGLVQTLNAAAVFFLCAFSLFLLTQKKGKRSSNRILAFFLLALALSTLNSPLSHDKRLVSFFLPLFLVVNSVDFLMGPLLYLYVRSVVFRDFAWERDDVLHAIPFLIYLLFLTINLIAAPATFKDLLLYRKSFFRTSAMSFFTALVAGQLLSYVGASCLVLRSYRARIKNSFSSLEKINLSWLGSIIGGSGLMWLVLSADGVQAVSMRSGRHSLVLSAINVFISLGMANVIVFRGLKQPEIFSGLEEKPKYEKSTLTDEEADRLLSSFLSYMEAKKPYLVSGLSIGGLAREMAVPVRYLSQVINSRLKKSFFDCINGYRVEEARRLLAEPHGNAMSILQVAFEAGFNSKAAFNRAFKKHAGRAPKEFRGEAGPKAG